MMRDLGWLGETLGKFRWIIIHHILPLDKSIMINRLVCKERLCWHSPCKGTRRMTRKPSMGSGTCWRTGWFEVFVKIERYIVKQKLSPSEQSSTKHLDAVAILVGRSRGLSWLCLLCRLIVIIINSHRCFTSHNKNCQSKNHSHHRMYQQCYIQRRCWAALDLLLGVCFSRPQRAFIDYIVWNLLNISSF